MNRLFGSKTAKPKPSLTDAIASTENRADSVEVKIRKLDSELARYRDQMRKMRDGPGKNAIQQRALRVLKQKRLYENQLAQLQQQSYNMEQATMTTENLRNTMATFYAMQTANKEMKKTYGKINLDKIESMQDEMEDLIEAANEVQETLGRSYGVPDEVDEEDLQAELDALADDWEAEEAAGESVPSYLQSNQELPDFVDELPNQGQAEGATAEHGEALRAV
ncbi:related to VPS60 involved in vacuolar protein sorting [Ustilago sp. UG-2017b]|nr:related to VPS60 involved in vacuolar protein sorting [Ustilago sp. UG-2017b]